MMYARPILRANAKGSRGIPLRIEFRYKDQRKEWTIAKIEPAKWNAVKNEVKGDQMLNLRIRDIINRFDAAINQKLNNQEPIDVNKLAGEIIGKTSGYKSPKLLDLLVEMISTGGKEYGTIKTYNALLVKIKEFDPEIRISRIDHVWIEKFEAYLKKQGNESGTIWTRRKVLKTVLNKAIKDGHIKTNPALGMKIKKESKIPQYLTLEEFKLLSDYKPQNKLESLAKDLYCFGVYTGLRFSDIFFLAGEDIRTDGKDSYRLYLKEVKTGNKISNKLSIPAITLLKKYGFPKDGVLFPMLKPSATGDRLIDNKQKESWNAYVNKTLYKIWSKMELRRMGFHTSRHTHACISLDLGIPITTISASLGHSKLSMTEHYARVKNKQLDEAAEKWGTVI